jgi:arylsulfatase A-like enzyme
MTRTSFLAAALLTVAFASPARSAEPVQAAAAKSDAPAVVPVKAGQRPNIIFIMTDDHAAHALSCYGSKVNTTPQLDRLAAGGMRFDRAFVTNSICTPSRATLLTGQYSHLNGVPVFNPFDPKRMTVARLLQSAGYHTGMIGKWHLGSEPVGFDHWIILPGQGAYVNPLFLVPGGTRKIEGYASDVITDLGIKFLDDRPRDKPFLLFLHHKAPHRNWVPDERNRAKFADKDFPEPPTLRDDYAGRPAALPENKQTVTRDLNKTDLKGDPPPGLSGDELLKWKYRRYMQDYLACVAGVDDNVGRFLDHLEKAGLAQNTVVLYTSDNGFFLGDMGMYDKRFMYEPSLRIPLLVRWPGVVQAGSTTDRFALNIDFAPTFLDIAGQPIPADMQGRSLVPLFKGEAPADWRQSMYYRYYHDPGHHNTRAHYGVRTRTHKLIHYWKKDAWEMFDLVADPNEQKNLAGDPAHKDLFVRLKAELYRLKKKFKDDDQFADKQPGGGVDGVPKVKAKDKKGEKS